MSDEYSETCIWEPWGAQEATLIRAALGATDIKFRIENENYSQLVSGVDGLADARMKVIVESSRAAEAHEIVQDILKRRD